MVFMDGQNRMKKRNVFAVWIMSFILLLTACGLSNAFIGTWTGNYEVTEIVESVYRNSLEESDELFEECIDFDELNVAIEYMFTEDTVQIGFSDKAKEVLRSDIKKNLEDIFDKYMHAYADKEKVTVDDLYIQSDTTYEDSLNHFLNSMKIDQMVDIVAESLQISGTYTYDDEIITIYYDDNTYENMQYVFENENLILTISNGTTIKLHL